jgi:glycosyltransferase involved in cell wall biosynthesis
MLSPRAFPAQLFVTVAAGPEDGVQLRWQGGGSRAGWLTAADLGNLEVWDEGVVIWHERPGWSADYLSCWRLQKRRSGFAADLPALDRPEGGAGLTSGLSLIIRAKNEAGNIVDCLQSIAGLADEIVFVDNGSSDDTLRLAEQQRKSVFELRTFSYPELLPKVGEPHAQEVRAGTGRTLGHFYNWCLAQSSRWNFAKWDADYIAIRDNLSEMIERFDLRLRGDPFVLWFSGLEMFTDGRRWWIDQNSAHSEFRVFSRKHGHRWVNIPVWEEIDQAALFTSHKLFFPKPVYVELFRLDAAEFNDRGTFLKDPRDRARLDYLREFQRSGTVPKTFMPVEGPFDKRLAALPLSPRERELAAFCDRRYRAAPALAHRASPLQLGFEVMRQYDFVVFIASSGANLARRRQIRASWGNDLHRLGISYYFVVSRPAQPACVIDDVLYLDVPDAFEFSAAKITEAMAYSCEFMNADFVFKVDDDCVLDAFKLLRCRYQDTDFTAGRLIEGGAESAAPDAGRCGNAQLDALAYAPAQAARSVDGSLGYFLSRRARALLGENAGLARRFFADGPGVTTALAAAGIAPVTPFGSFAARRWTEPAAIFAADVLLVGEVPDEAAAGVYERLVGRDAYARERQASEAQLAVRYDWADVTGPSPDGRAP